MDDLHHIERGEDKDTRAETMPINTENEFLVGHGQNMANHSISKAGRAHWVGPVQLPLFRTKQQAYRFTGYLLTQADTFLPDEDGAHSLEEIIQAIRNT